MGRLGIAFRLFFRVLKDEAFAARGQLLLEAPTPESTPIPIAAPAQPRPPEPARSEAITLLSVLQRESRLIDFLKENMTPYSDAQVGAAARDVHRDAAAVLDRIFGLTPVMNQAEGTRVEILAGTDLARVRLTGNVTGEAPFSGILRHGGWQVGRTSLPAWNGSPAVANIVAPAEVEL
ncbi:MAG TPA: DUF2760 domain-containing protein [Tepidisphaeraceae bacterium]|jgi:hypothetical protein|nr:DUF2760 domain-containing protein [Tepidisphaeraceae bacterium]